MGVFVLNVCGHALANADFARPIVIVHFLNALAASRYVDHHLAMEKQVRD